LKIFGKSLFFDGDPERYTINESPLDTKAYFSSFEIIILEHK